MDLVISFVYKKFIFYSFSQYLQIYQDLPLTLSMNKSSKGRGKNNKRSKVSEGNKGDVEKFEDYVIKARLITNRFKNLLLLK